MNAVLPPRSGIPSWRRLLVRAALVASLVLIATACTSSGDENGSASATTSVSASATTATNSPSTTRPSTSEPSTSPPAVGGPAGALAIGGLSDLVLAAPDGEQITTSPPEVAGFSTQPTWARDGSRAVGFLPNSNGGQVVVVSNDESWVAEARRGYFFFSWSGDGRYIAALGPGPRGTTLDILTAEGELATEQSLNTGSFYLAWEPGGDDLVIHRDRSLELVRDPLDLDEREPLGSPGQSFLAPAWIPGTRDVVIVDGDNGGRLLRLDVDTAERVELGTVTGQAGFVVSPDGRRLFLTHGAGEQDDGLIAASFNPASFNPASFNPAQFNPAQSASVREAQPAIGGVTEIVDLGDGRRSEVNGQLSLWGEWSPDGSAAAFLQVGNDGGAWRIVDDTGVRDVADGVRLSNTFFRNYVFFAWQFVESPRIWSPDGDAIVYAAANSAGTGIIVHPIDGDPERVSDGNVAFWSPRAAAGASSAA